MDRTEVFEVLRARTKPGAVRLLRKQGVTSETWGVSFAEIELIARKIRVDQDLARELWNSGHHDARMLATRIVDPAVMTGSEVDDWIAEVDNNILAGAIAGMTSRRSDAPAIARTWICSPDEWPSSSGWMVVAETAMDGRVEMEEARELLARISAGIASAPNRTKLAMNNALIAIGGSMPPLRETAIAVARTVGRIEVDTGETGGTAPDAVEYIERMAEHLTREGAMEADRRPSGGHLSG